MSDTLNSLFSIQPLNQNDIAKKHDEWIVENKKNDIETSQLTSLQQMSSLIDCLSRLSSFPIPSHSLYLPDNK